MIKLTESTTSELERNSVILGTVAKGEGIHITLSLKSLQFAVLDNFYMGNAKGSSLQKKKSSMHVYHLGNR